MNRFLAATLSFASLTALIFAPLSALHAEELNHCSLTVQPDGEVRALRTLGKFD